MANITAITASEIDNLQKLAKVANSAEAKFNRAFVEVCDALWRFKHQHDKKAIDGECQSQSITVKGGAAFPLWTKICRLAFGTGGTSDQQVDKYKRVMAYAEHKKTAEDGMAGFIGEKTFTDLVNNARLVLAPKGGKGGSKKTDKLEAELEKVKEKWEPLFADAEGIPTNVDMEAFGLKEGRIEILAEVDADGNIVPIGAVQATASRVYDLIKPVGVRETKSKKHTYAHIKKLYGFANAVEMSSKVARLLFIVNREDSWTMYVSGTDRSTPIAIANFSEPHKDLPQGVWVLGNKQQKAFSSILANMKAMQWGANVGSRGHLEIAITDSASKTVKERIKEINEAKEKAWKNVKGKKPAKAPEFLWPDSATGGTLKIENGAEREAARVRNDVQEKFEDFDLALTRRLRDQFIKICKDDKIQWYCRIRVGVTKTTFLPIQTGDPIGEVVYNARAQQGFEKFFAIDVRAIGRVMDAINSVVGEGDCRLAFSETIMRLTAETDNGEYEIYLPALGAGNFYVTDELVSSNIK